MIDLQDKLVVITGAGRGNGAAIAAGMAKAGATVWAVDLQFDEGLLLAVSRGICGDVRDQDIIASTCSEAASTGADVVLVNNAGITLPSPHPYPIDSWDRTLQVNLTAPFLWMEAVIPQMIDKRSGSIINITSLAAERGFADNPAYIASKGGLKMLTKAYAKSLGAFRIRANNVGPGYMRTSMTERSHSDEGLRGRISRHTLLGRWGEPDDLVGVCNFLASESAQYITGQDFYVDGGWLANGLSE